MTSLQDKAYIQASKTAHNWLQKAASLPAPDRIAFMEYVAKQIYPFFSRDVNAAFLYNMKKGMTAQMALQTSLIQTLQNFYLAQVMGMGTIDPKASGGSTSAWDMFNNVTTGLNSLVDTGMNIFTSVRTQRREDEQADWQRTMQATTAAHQQEMDRLLAEARARELAAASADTSRPSQRTIISEAAPDNTGLYVALGIGAIALLGGALILTRKN